MYCVNCGVRLGESEKRCPLCGTAAYHPDLPDQDGPPPYPAWERQEFKPNPSGVQLLITIAMALIAALCVLVDITGDGRSTWSGYAVGGMGLAYLLIILPGWFQHPNPVIFVALDFVGLGCYLLYIDLVNRGGWYLSFAFPLVGIYGLLVETVVVLCHYLHRGRLYVFAGAFLFLGCSMLLLELFVVITFGGSMFSWSLYPLTALCAIGLFLLLAALLPR